MEGNLYMWHLTLDLTVSLTQAGQISELVPHLVLGWCSTAVLCFLMLLLVSS